MSGDGKNVRYSKFGICTSLLFESIENQIKLTSIKNNKTRLYLYKRDFLLRREGK